MQYDKPDYETLNAYVDGELSAEEAAVVAHAIACDGQIAHQVDVLSRLRSAVVESVEAPNLSTPDANTTELSHSSVSGRSVKTGLIAACVAGMLMVGGTMLTRTYDRTVVDAWMLPAWEIHQTWDTPSSEAVVNLASVSNDSLANMDLASLNNAYVPDLTSAKLFVAHVSGDHQFRGQNSLLVGYSGTRGCKVSLLATANTAPLSNELTYFERNTVSLYGWRVGELDYFLMAEGMDHGRFQSIADAAYSATRARLPISEEMRMALNESREKSAPCLA